MADKGLKDLKGVLKRTRKKQESGRSMVEMLAVLAIVGVLSIGAVSGYSLAMRSHKTNKLLNEASKRAVVAISQLNDGKSVEEASFAEFADNTFDGATFATHLVAVPYSSNQVAIQVDNVEQGICRNLISKSGTHFFVAKIDTLDTPMVPDDCAENRADNSLGFVYDMDVADETNELNAAGYCAEGIVGYTGYGACDEPCQIGRAHV